MSAVFAHAGHWTVSLLYVAPVIIIIAWLYVQSRRNRRGDDDS